MSEDDLTLSVDAAGGAWRIEAAAQKLLARGGLPGAFGYDLAAEALRRARAAGVPARDLLAPALPGSWMVNSPAASPTFQRWLKPPFPARWAELLEHVWGGPSLWLAQPASARAAAEKAVRALAIDGLGVAAISKVLALLAPETAPLMDDSAIALGIGAVPRPPNNDDPRAGPEHFVPMLDWFARAVVALQAPLTALARGYPLAPLEPAQVLDRLLWFDSYGRRMFESAGIPWRT